MLGAIDVTTNASDFRDDSLGLVNSLANQIQLIYKVEFEADQFHLVNTFLMYADKCASDRIIVVDALGNVVRKSQSASDFVPGDRLSEADLNSKNLHYEVMPINSVNQNQVAGKVYIIQAPKRRTTPLHETTRDFCGYLTRDKKVIASFKALEKVAGTHVPVLIIGETGTGKELAARYIHENSPYRKGPFVAVNCGSLSRELFQSSFFGYVRGAFTGADPSGRKGFVEQAHGGTLFLDEVGEMPFEFQAALLRVMENKVFSRLGSEKEKKVDFRIVSATNRNLQEKVEQGSFRADFFYRLNATRFLLSPLRERPDDLTFLLHYFIDQYCKHYSCEPKTIEEQAICLLMQHRWNGNVRELKNTIETMVILTDETITVQDIPDEILLRARQPQPAGEQRQGQETRAGSDADSDAGEYEDIVRLLGKHLHTYQVAKELGISRSTLYRKLKILGIDPKTVGIKGPH